MFGKKIHFRHILAGVNIIGLVSRRLQPMKRVRSIKKEKSELIDAKKLCDIEDLHRVHIDRIRQMRAGGNAPVDTMGCHKLADPLATPEIFRFQVLVSLMLSSQTRDQTNAAAMLRLKQHGLNIESMIAIDVKELENLLVPVSFFRRKAVNIKKVAQLLKDNYSGDVPNTVEGLCSLPGVGPKMSHLVMQIAWNQVEGVAVDVHVHRIANRLGWMKTTKPEETRERLQEMLPRSEWEWINPLLVGFGQTICLPLRPKCSECLCRLICPSSTDRKPEEAPV